MMELQTLQEALKVEIQIHQKLVAQMKQDPQNADLKKQLHELQAKITALSEKQKKVVEQLRKELLVKQEPEAKLQLQTPPAGGDIRPVSLLQSQQIPGGLQQTLTVTPVLTTKTLPLVLKAAVTPVLPGSVLPQRPAAIAMVTAAISKPDSLNAPINLQVAGKLTSQSSEPVRLVSKNTMVVQATTTSTSSTTAQPIKVPQFVPPPRLTPRPTFQPQVRPKPATPTNIPIAPAPPPPMMAAPQLLQRPVMLATKLSTSHPAAAPIHQVRIVNGQPCSKTGSTPLTGIVIATSVSARPTRLASPAQALNPTPTPVQPIQISSLTPEPKTVRLGGGAEQKFVVSHASSTPPLSPAPRPKREENPEKLAFMVSLGLVTHDHLEEIQSKRQERKRRTTANPVYSGAVFEPERKKSAVSYLNSPLHQATRKRGRPPKHSSVPELGSLTPASPSSPVHPPPLPSPSSGDGDIHEDFCTVCRRSGQLLMCDTCSRVYHLDCLDPPLKTIPKGMWICPKCQDQILKKEDAIPWPGTLAIVHSYIAYKEAKEEEKLKLMKWSSELKLEREQLEQRVKQLSNSITKCMETKNTILSRQKDMQLSLDKVKHLIRLIQAFSFNQALPETEGEDTRVQDGVQDGAGREPGAASASSSTNGNEEGKDKPEQLRDAARVKTAAGDTKDQDVPEDAAETSPSVRTRAEDRDGPGVGTGAEEGTGAEDRDRPGVGTGAEDGTGVGTGAENRDGTGVGTGAEDGTGVGTGAEDGTGVGTGAENRDRSCVGTGAEERPGVGIGAEEGTGAEDRDRPGVGTGAEDGTGVGTGAENRDGPSVGTGAEDGTGVGTGGAGKTGTGTQSEVTSTSDTPPGVDLPAPSAGATVVATTNGTTEPTCPDRDPAGDSASTTNSENKMAAVHPPEMAVDRRQEEISDSTNNSKTSEPSQNSLPALVSSLDKTK